MHAHHDLLKAALAARRAAYAPYSGYHVGAAIRTETGEIVSGCNVENTSYGLTVCAERNAIHAAISQGHRKFSEILIVADGVKRPTPCGACRQVLAEFGKPDMAVHLAVGETGPIETHLLGELLPHAFKLTSCQRKS